MEVGVAYVVSGVLLAIIAITTVFFLKLKRGSQTSNETDVANVPQNQPRPRGVARGDGPVRRAVRNRLAARHRDEDESGSDGNMDEDEDLGLGNQWDAKIGKKKQMKLEAKAARKAQREAEDEERREKREREEKQEHKRKKLEEEKQREEAIRTAEEQRLKEEQAKREHEEYLKMKEAFSVDEEGVDAQEEQDVQSLLQEFINYIEQTKVVMLEDLASHFKLKTQDAVDRVKTLQSEGRLSGVIDDRGKFICITDSEYDAVAKFIKQRGRVSISELAESMNRLIRLQADTSITASYQNNEAVYA